MATSSPDSARIWGRNSSITCWRPRRSGSRCPESWLTQSLWERACSRRGRHIRHQCRLTHRLREQARSHSDVHL
ncbi:MAG TPA: hypothetical protein DIW52_03075, partial [Pseudomonas sp.]|nr:hypothetical protein [Pseudomonas sp.]